MEENQNALTNANIMNMSTIYKNQNTCLWWNDTCKPASFNTLFWVFVVFQTCSESVTSVQGGVIASAGYDEIVCATYAGKIYTVET